MPAENTSPAAQPTRTSVRARVIVAQDQPCLFRSLRVHLAANEDIEVLFDRRLWERRQQVQTYDSDRRGSDRRQPMRIENDVRYRKYVIVRAQHGSHLN
jgi:hypothetical protein